ncbi:MAG: GGDEF domain-containing protein [Longicatena sp.]
MNKGKEQKDTRKGMISFKPIVKYILFFYMVILVVELFAGGFYTAYIMCKQNDTVIKEVTHKISYRIDNTLMLLESLAQDTIITDDNVLPGDKIKALDKYKKSFNYFMVRYVDANINVYNEDGRATSLASRDYMQKLFATGKYQVTDSFAAGTDGTTINYTIAYPIMKDKKVNGCIFASVYFDDIQKRLEEGVAGDYQVAMLLGNKNQVMSIDKPTLIGNHYSKVVGGETIFQTNLKDVEKNMLNQKKDNYWSMNGLDLTYTSYQNVEKAPWKVVCRIGFIGMYIHLLPELLPIFFLTTLFCVALAYFINRFIVKQSKTMNMLVTSIEELEKKIYLDEKPDDLDFKEIISLTSKGLTDGLTGVITRSVFVSQVTTMIKGLDENTLSVLCFVDVDDLKYVNDTYGHALGDITLKNVGYILREFEKKHDGLVGRYGGDEFVVLLTGFKTREELVYVLNDLAQRLHENVAEGDIKFATHCSVGATLCNANDADIDALIAKADAALYEVKQSNKGTYHISE